VHTVGAFNLKLSVPGMFCRPGFLIVTWALSLIPFMAANPACPFVSSSRSLRLVCTLATIAVGPYVYWHPWGLADTCQRSAIWRATCASASASVTVVWQALGSVFFRRAVSSPALCREGLPALGSTILCTILRPGLPLTDQCAHQYSRSTGLNHHDPSRPVSVTIEDES
jgi:hypothetical protein